MKLFFQSIILGGVISLSLVACGQSKKAAVSSTPAHLIQASVKRTLPGRPEGNIEKKYRFLIRWQSSEKPEQAYFVNDGQWMPCAVNKFGSRYSTSEIKKGDTLQLIASSSSVVSAMRPNINSTNLIFKTSKSSWQTLLVSKIEKEPDVEMP